jgi:hypothetical protein
MGRGHKCNPSQGIFEKKRHQEIEKKKQLISSTENKGNPIHQGK